MASWDRLVVQRGSWGLLAAPWGPPWGAGCSVLENWHTFSAEVAKFKGKPMRMSQAKTLFFFKNDEDVSRGGAWGRDQPRPPGGVSGGVRGGRRQPLARDILTIFEKFGF